jgi:hypothetical protein
VDSDDEVVCYVYFNGTHCIAAPCPSYTIRGAGLNRTVTDLDVTALSPDGSIGQILRGDLYDGRWWIRGTVDTELLSVGRERVTLHVAELLLRVDQTAAELSADRLYDGEDPRPHIEVLRATLKRVADRVGRFGEEPVAFPDPLRHVRRLEAELDELAAWYAALDGLSGDDLTRRIASLAHELGECAGTIIRLAIREQAGIDDALADSWLVPPTGG